jgi:DNA-binding XRE family transcriptional regulator
MKPVRFGRDAARALRRTPRPAAELVRDALAAYAADPAGRAADAWALKGERAVMRLRAGDRRATFVDGGVIVVVRVGSCGGYDGEARMGETVTIPREEYERLRALAEDAEDAAAVARFRDRLAAGEEELAPAALVERLLGASPVRVWREHRGLTQSGLARASGVNRVVVADIEAGRKGGSVRSLKALAAALGVGVDDLV